MKAVVFDRVGSPPEVLRLAEVPSRRSGRDRRAPDSVSGIRAVT